MKTARRADMELARARAVLLAAHAQLAMNITARLSDRLPTTRLIELYCREQHLPDFEEVWLRIHVLAHAGAGGADSPGAADDTPLRRVLQYVRADVEAYIAPWADDALRETLTYEFATARAVVTRVHVRNAVRMAQALEPDVSGITAVALYTREMPMPDDLRGAVRAFALAQLGTARHTPMLAPPADAAVSGHTAGDAVTVAAG